MSDDKNQDFVEIPTMTIRKAKPKNSQNRTILIAAILMAIGIVIVVAAVLFLM